MARLNGFAAEEIVDLADARARHSGVEQRVQQSFSRRLDRIIPTIGGALVRSGLTGERPRNDAGDIVRRLQKPACQLTRAIKLRQGNDAFVRGNLKNGIRRSVHDPAAGPLVLGAKPIDDLGPARDGVADDGAARVPCEALQDCGGKAVRKRREGSFEVEASNFPVSSRAVLAGRGRAHGSPRAGRVTAPLNPLEVLDVSEAKPFQTRECETAGRAGEISQRIAARVPVRHGVRRRADSYAVENEDYRPLHAGASE